MKRSSDLSTSDVTERQQQTLDYVLAAENRAKKNASLGPKVSISDARAGDTHFEVASDRETTRLLFISQDVSLLNQTKKSLDGYLNLSDVFDEVHIMIIQKGKPATNPVLRAADNVWMYVVSAPTLTLQIDASKKMLQQQLEFADGFRADMIVARDPFISAYLALWASKKFNRPTQLHMLEDYTVSHAFSKFPYPRFMRLWYRYLVRQFKSIRTNVDSLTRKIKMQYSSIADIATLPRFHNFEALVAGMPTSDIKEKYQDFSFIILYIGALDFGSKGFQAIDAARNLMRSPKIGLVMVGDGAARTEFMKRAELLGIKTQVVFEKTTDDIAGYLKSADVLLVPEITEQSDELAILGAAAGIPLVIAETKQRLDLFVPEQAALFFNENDIVTMSNQMKKVLNDPGAREVLVRTARDTVTEKLHEDPLQYRLEYRDSVEGALFTEDSEVSASR